MSKTNAVRVLDELGIAARYQLDPSTGALGARADVVKANQIDIVPPAVLRYFEQIEGAEESRLARQFKSDIWEADLLDRIHDDCAILHRISPADPHVRARPDAHAASDLPAPHPLPQPLGKNHAESLL
jgi:hypothetical protein